MNDYSVYIHTTPSGKVYVGITRQENPNRRWQNGYGYRTQVLFYRAIQKYGWESIKHEVVLTGLSKEDAENKEIELIAKYKATDPRHGYNCDNGGNCFGTHSEETKKKISEAQLGEKNHMYGKHSWCYGKKMSAETIEKNRLGHLGKPSPNKGKRMTEKQKEKMHKPKTEDHKRKLSEARSRPVMCVETGEVFRNGIDAGHSCGVARGSISNAARGKTNTAGGYHWQYVNEG